MVSSAIVEHNVIVRLYRYIPMYRYPWPGKLESYLESCGQHVTLALVDVHCIDISLSIYVQLMYLSLRWDKLNTCILLIRRPTGSTPRPVMRIIAACGQRGRCNHVLVH